MAGADIEGHAFGTASVQTAVDCTWSASLMEIVVLSGRVDIDADIQTWPNSDCRMSFYWEILQ